mmetsp:Transcript_3734/g.7406  ORF Transcript_3734/g.7406 Transcript_3734/m.7406 type:complete len:115 (+) Transcript_3734:1331-1675(+)
MAGQVSIVAMFVDRLIRTGAEAACTPVHIATLVEELDPTGSKHPPMQGWALTMLEEVAPIIMQQHQPIGRVFPASASHPLAAKLPGMANPTNIASHVDNPVELAAQELGSWQVA